jgi:hypothetical protein
MLAVASLCPLLVYFAMTNLVHSMSLLLGGRHGEGWLQVMGWVMLTRFSDCYFVSSNRVSFNLRFHNMIPALHEENRALHIP